MGGGGGGGGVTVGEEEEDGPQGDLMTLALDLFAWSSLSPFSSSAATVGTMAVVTPCLKLTRNQEAPNKLNKRWHQVKYKFKRGQQLMKINHLRWH